jgi:hypothetical protein
VNQPIVQYCENCGKPLTSRARFCGRCGKPVLPAEFTPSSPQNHPTIIEPPLTQNPFTTLPVQQPPPADSQTLPPTQILRPVQPPPATPQPARVAQPTEMVVAALPMGALRSGFMGLKAEGIVLVLTNLRILFARQTSEIMQENSRRAKEEARQNGKGFFSQWGAVIGSSSSQRYLQMQPQNILNEANGNYFIFNNQIRSVKVQEISEPDQRSEIRLTLDTVSEKLELTYTQSTDHEIKQILRQTLGNLVR